MRENRVRAGVEVVVLLWWNDIFIAEFNEITPTLPNVMNPKQLSEDEK